MKRKIDMQVDIPRMSDMIGEYGEKNADVARYEMVVAGAMLKVFDLVSQLKDTFGNNCYRVLIMRDICKYCNKINNSPFEECIRYSRRGFPPFCSNAAKIDEIHFCKTYKEAISIAREYNRPLIYLNGINLENGSSTPDAHYKMYRAKKECLEDPDNYYDVSISSIKQKVGTIYQLKGSMPDIFIHDEVKKDE